MINCFIYCKRKQKRKRKERGNMKNLLTERMEIRITPRQKVRAERLAKKMEVSIGAVFRMSLINFNPEKKGKENGQN